MILLSLGVLLMLTIQAIVHYFRRLSVRRTIAILRTLRGGESLSALEIVDRAKGMVGRGVIYVELCDMRGRETIRQEDEHRSRGGVTVRSYFTITERGIAWLDALAWSIGEKSE